MKISEHLEKKLKNKFEPDAYIEMKYKGNDLAIKTDAEGNAVLLFVGKKQADGKIKGDRFSRTLKHDRDGKLLKDHWEQKGKAT